MPVTPFSDRLGVIDIITADPYITSLGFERENILNTQYSDDTLDGDKLQIFVFAAPSNDGENDLYISPVIEVDISAPQSKASRAHKAAEQVIALLHGREINGHTALQLVAPSPANLPCQFGYECIGLRFRYNATIVNKVRTI